jgi:hypothetical protein
VAIAAKRRTAGRQIEEGGEPMASAPQRREVES